MALFALPLKCRVPAPALNSRPALRSPWISENWKKSLELFWRKNGRPWKVWNLSIVKVSTRLGDCVNCRSCCKAGRRTAQTVLLVNITHQCFQLVHLFSWVSVITRTVCYRMINWKKGLELALNYWMKRPWKALNCYQFRRRNPVNVAMLIIAVARRCHRCSRRGTGCVVWGSHSQDDTAG